MDKKVVYLVTFVVLILFQLGLAPAIAIGGCQPNFLLVCVLLVAMHSGPVAGAVAGFFLGLLYDFAGSEAIGCMALTYVLIAVIAGVLLGNVESKSPLISVITVVVASFLMELVYAAAIILTSAGATGVIATTFGYALPSGLYTAILGCIGLVTMNLVTADSGPQVIGLGSKTPKAVFKTPRRFK